ncbi:MAG: hypothetical protein R3F44_10030 [Candidatus Competibacteraceae bacterium]
MIVLVGGFFTSGCAVPYFCSWCSGLLALPIIQMVIPVALFLAALPLAFLVSDGTTRQFSAGLSASILAPLLTLGLMVDGELWETWCRIRKNRC